MSIQNEVNRINKNISDTYDILEAYGAPSPIQKNSNSLASTAQNIKAILYKAQTLTEAEKAQARTNIGSGNLSFQVTFSSDTSTAVVKNSNFKAAGYAYIVLPSGVSYNIYAEKKIYAEDVTIDGEMTFKTKEASIPQVTVNILRLEV